MIPDTGNLVCHAALHISIFCDLAFANQSVGIFVFFIGREGEDRGDLQVMLSFSLFALKCLVGLGQRIDRTHTHDGREIAVMRLAVVVLNEGQHRQGYSIAAPKKLTTNTW